MPDNAPSLPKFHVKQVVIWAPFLHLADTKTAKVKRILYCTEPEISRGWWYILDVGRELRDEETVYESSLRALTEEERA